MTSCPPSFSENHQRALFYTISQIYSQILQIESIVREQEHSRFSKVNLDLNPAESEMVLALADDLKKKLGLALERLGISKRESKVDARHSIEILLTFSEIALDEVEAKRLRGYGELEPEFVEALDHLLSDLRGAITRFKEALRRPIESDYDAAQVLDFGRRKNS